MTRNVRDAVIGYLEETWDESTRDAIVERGADLAVDYYGEAVLGGDAPAALPDRAAFRDVVYGPETHQGELVQAALEQAHDSHRGAKYGMVREQAEFAELQDWDVFEQGRRGVVQTELQLFHNGRPGDYDARVTLYPRVDDHNERPDGEKSVEVALPGIDLDEVKALPHDVLDGALTYNVSAPNTVEVALDDRDEDDLVAAAVEQARDETAVSDRFQYEAAFDGGELDADEHRVHVTLNAYTPDAEQVLDALDV